jgi:hypothetical protein
MAMNEDLDEREWYEAIATVLAQKPPSSWADADIAVFESAALEVAGPFLRLELLYREMGAKPAQGFRSSRVTVTQPEGQEDARVLAIETGRESEMSASLDGFISDMDRKFGTGAKDALLVLLAEKVLSAASPTMDDSAKPKKSSSAGR